ncbi:MAG TPA: hypothetical protein VK465_13860 [Fibrobacteria bacterium]|nr:hypothetical protein [Fibrobacteria bacterium]
MIIPGTVRRLPVLLVLLLVALPARAKVTVSVLGTWVEGQDSAFNADLARDLGQVLADDTTLLVYDLRRKHGRALDSAAARRELDRASLLMPIAGGIVKWGLSAECRENRKEEARGDISCGLDVLSMADGQRISLDTVRFLPEAVGKRKRLGQSLAHSFLVHFVPKHAEARSMGTLRIQPPANPAMLVRDMQILRRGPIDAIPLGATLSIGDAPVLHVISMDNMHYVLYPNSSYTYLLPRVVQVNAGTLGIFRGDDSSSIAGRLKSATALDSSNLIWRNLAKVAAMDSSNLIWRSLGRVSSLDSNNILLYNLLTRQLGKVTTLDSTNLLLRTLGQATAMDSSNLVFRTLSQVAALDSSNLVWKGLGKVSTLDSSNFLWQKLGMIASMDSNSIWRKLGLLAFQDSTIVLTSSMIVRGLPQAALVRQDGSVSTLEVVRGAMVAHPLLGAQTPERVGALRIARTRGFSLKQERMNPLRGDRLIREFETVNPARGTRSLADFLPGKLFTVGASLRTPDRPIQAFISGEFRELDMEVDVLSSEREGWNETGAFRTGSQESGCYLCSPGRIGP